VAEAEEASRARIDSSKSVAVRGWVWVGVVGSDDVVLVAVADDLEI